MTTVDAGFGSVSDVADGGEAHISDTSSAFTSGDIHAFKSGGTKKSAVLYDGTFYGPVWDNGGAVYNAKHPDYGAKGDNSSDDTSALQAWIDAVEASGGVGVLPPGTYLVSLTGNGYALQVDADDVTLRLAAGASIKLADNELSGAGTGHVLQVGNGSTARSNIAILGPGRIDGNRANNSSSGDVTGSAGVAVDGPHTDVEISLDVENTVGTGIFATGVDTSNRGERLNIHSCKVNNCGEGIVWKFWDYVVVANNIASNLQATQDAFEAATADYFVIDGNVAENVPGSGIDLFGAQHGTVVGNTLHNCGTTAGASIVAGGTGGTRDTTDVVITGNEVHVNTTGNGIAVVQNTAQGNSRILIRGNDVSECEYGIHLANNPDNRVSGNVCYNNAISGIRTHGDGVVCKDNICFNNNQDNNANQGGILGTGGDRAVISGNVCYDTQGTATQDWGINLQSSVTNGVVEGNVFWGNDGGLNDGSGSGTVVRRNSGYTTENNGTATVASGTTSIAVNHGLDATPSIQDISVTPTNDPTNDVGNFWISSVGASQFTINVGADPGSGGATFAWKAAIE
ncbi:MAG: hypothetical protein GWN53_17275 [Gammaproteobacteria bacterium]|uniref:Right handed beta helix domain-containing protein n=1 Tax=Candidatus Kutchimonas denitrificans TaxID=3056748 RepID=A0AAE4ZD76_9BACT|nr:hypothetical protein [Candidatus Kutchimonas denitrificans]NIV53594.1 hypothetical protein [Gammaproteobacteria bacterium]